MHSTPDSPRPALYPPPPAPTRQLDLSDLLWERRPYEKWSSYGASKLANVLFTQELAQRESGTVTAAACHPGVVATQLARSILPEKWAKGARDDPEAYERNAKRFFLRTPREGSAASVWLAASDAAGAVRVGKVGEIYTDPGADSGQRMRTGCLAQNGLCAVVERQQAFRTLRVLRCTAKPRGRSARCPARTCRLSG